MQLKFQIKTKLSNCFFRETKLQKNVKRKSNCDKKITELPIWTSTPSFANTLLYAGFFCGAVVSGGVQLFATAGTRITHNIIFIVFKGVRD